MAILSNSHITVEVDDVSGCIGRITNSTGRHLLNQAITPEGYVTAGLMGTELGSDHSWYWDAEQINGICDSIINTGGVISSSGELGMFYDFAGGESNPDNQSDATWAQAITLVGNAIKMVIGISYSGPDRLANVLNWPSEDSFAYSGTHDWNMLCPWVISSDNTLNKVRVYQGASPWVGALTELSTLPGYTGALKEGYVHSDEHAIYLSDESGYTFGVFTPDSESQYWVHGITPDDYYGITGALRPWIVGGSYTTYFAVGTLEEVRAQFAAIANPKPIITASPAQGTYAGPQTVTLSCDIPGSVICYTIGDGTQSDPDPYEVLVTEGGVFVTEDGQLVTV